ncbi:alpha-2Db adrenergic receptor-like isoform X2 [Rhopilema esculentum]|eukprot:gene13475-4354_t
MGNGLNKTEQSQAFYWSLVVTDIVTFILNILVLAMFLCFREKLLGSNHNRILCSMALADALVGIFGNNLGVLLLLKKKSVYYKLLGNVPLFSCMFVSILSLILLTVDRLIAIKRPHIYGSANYRNMLFRLIIATWIFPGLIIIQNSLIYLYISSKQELIVRSSLFTAFFAVGVLVLIVSNSFLFVAIRGYAKRYAARSKFSNVDIRGEKSSADHSYTGSETQDNNTSGPFSKYIASTEELSVGNAMNKNDENSNCQKKGKRRKRKISKHQELKQTSLICLLSVVLFILLWLPLAGYRFCYATGIKMGIPWLRRLALCLTIANSFFNPIIYLLVKKEFRTYIKRLICKLNPFKGSN